jgi:hypothetical protein
VARRISRQEYERRYGPPPADAVQAVAGNFLTETKFEEAYAQLVSRSLSHEDAVRAARQQVYGKPRNPGVGPQGPENVAAINWYKRRMAGGGSSGGGRPPGAPPPSPINLPPGPAAAGAMRLAGTRLPQLLAYALAGAGGATGAWLSLNSDGGQP